MLYAVFRSNETSPRHRPVSSARSGPPDHLLSIIDLSLDCGKLIDRLASFSTSLKQDFTRHISRSTNSYIVQRALIMCLLRDLHSMNIRLLSSCYSYLQKCSHTYDPLCDLFLIHRLSTFAVYVLIQIVKPRVHYQSRFFLFLSLSLSFILIEAHSLIITFIRDCFTKRIIY